MSKDHRIIHARLPDATATICGLKNKGPLAAGTYIPPEWRMCKRCGKDGVVTIWLDDERKTTALGGALAEGLPVGVRQTSETRDNRPIEAVSVTTDDHKWVVSLKSWSITRLPDEEVA